MKMIILIILVLLVRFVLALLPPFEIDQNVWRFWSLRMAELGPLNFYSPEVFTDYTPGFLYILWVVGLAWKYLFSIISNNNLMVFDFLIKFPMTLGDLATGLLIYKIIKEKLTEKTALIAFLVYTLNPLTILNASIWGQFDGITTFLLLLAFTLIYKKRLMFSVLILGIAWATKPQIISLLPFFAVLTLVSNFKFTQIIKATAIFIGSVLLIYLPFFPSNPISGFIYVNQRLADVYNCTTCFAFNFWGIFGNWGDDNTLFLGVKYFYLGIILVAIFLSIILLIPPLKKRFTLPYAYLTASLSIMAFCLFFTRMHERYIFPSIAFLLIAALLLKSKVLTVYFLIFSILFTLNVYTPYAYYGSNPTYVQNVLSLPLANFFTDHFKLISFITTLSFLSLLIYFLKLISIDVKSKS